MTTYTNVFGGSPVQTADVSYNAILDISEDVTLVWPTAYQNTQNFVARIMNVSATEGALTITLPDATLTSVGTDILFVNVGTVEVQILDSESAALFTLEPDAPTYMYLEDNSTAGGTWNFIPFGSGSTAGINNIIITTGEGLTVSGSPITAPSGTINLEVSGSLELLSDPLNFGGNGYLVWTGTQFISRALTSGDANIVITNPEGLAGNPSFSLDPNVVTISGTLTNAAVPIAVASIDGGDTSPAIHGFGVLTYVPSDGTSYNTITFSPVSAYPVIQLSAINAGFSTEAHAYIPNLISVTSTGATYVFVDSVTQALANPAHCITIWNGQS